MIHWSGLCQKAQAGLEEPTVVRIWYILALTGLGQSRPALASVNTKESNFSQSELAQLSQVQAGHSNQPGPG